MKLGEKQELFFRLWVRLCTYVLEEVCPLYNVTVRMGECRVLTPRKVWYNGRQIRLEDAEHIRGSTHYHGVAGHLLFFDAATGSFLTEARHPAYRAAGAFWELLHPDTRWGGNWDKDTQAYEHGENDAVHFSIVHAGKA